MNNNHFDVLVTGSANLDHIVFTGGLQGYFNGLTLAGKTSLKKSPDHPEGSKTILGGSAVNTSWAMAPIAAAIGMSTIVYKSMRLGRDRDNPVKSKILEMFGNPQWGDRTLIDGMCGTNYKTPTNIVIENGDTQHDRLILKEPRDDFPLHPNTYDSLDYALARVQYVMANSSPFEEGLHVLRGAASQDILSVLDYSAKEPEECAKASQLIYHADEILMPHDARLPEMEAQDPHRLLKLAVEKYGRKSVAISNANEDVIVYHNGEYQSFKIEKVKVLMSCGAGDVRNAAHICARAAGYDFPQAVRIASDISTFFVSQPSREAFAHNLQTHIHDRMLNTNLYKKPEMPLPPATAQNLEHSQLNM